MHQVVQAVILGVLTGGVYALMASGLTLVFGIMKVINVAQGALVILAAYLSYSLFTRLHIDPFASIVILTPAMFLLGVAVQLVFIRTLRREEGQELSLLVTWALALGIEGALSVGYKTTYRATLPGYADKTWVVAGYSISGCSSIQNNLRGPGMPHGSASEAATRNRCNSYIGPYQPGITAPDPTGATSGAKVSKATRATRAGEQRRAGQPRALPLPGQFDPSVPHVALPPVIQSLIDRVKRGLPLPPGVKLPKLPPGVSVPGLPNRGAAPDQMLDFLLSP